MIHPETHKVGQDATRGRPNTCYYCHEPVGWYHNLKCPCRLRTIVVEYKIAVTVTIPEFFDEGTIDFHFNESSACRDNIIGQLQGCRTCLCDHVEARFVRDATADDEAAWKLPELERKDAGQPKPISLIDEGGF